MPNNDSINNTQYHLSTDKFVQVNHLRIKLPDGVIQEFSPDHTYIINAVDTNGIVVDFEDTDTQYSSADETLQLRQYNTDATDDNDKGKVYTFKVFNLRNRFEQGSNITITPVEEKEGLTTLYYKLRISATDTTYTVDNNTLQLNPSDNNKISIKSVSSVLNQGDNISLTTDEDGIVTVAVTGTLGKIYSADQQSIHLDENSNNQFSVKEDWLDKQISSFLTGLSDYSDDKYNTLKLNHTTSSLYWGQDDGGTGADGYYKYDNGDGSITFTGTGTDGDQAKSYDGNIKLVSASVNPAWLSSSSNNGYAAIYKALDSIVVGTAVSKDPTEQTITITQEQYFGDADDTQAYPNGLIHKDGHTFILTGNGNKILSSQNGTAKWVDTPNWKIGNASLKAIEDDNKVKLRLSDGLNSDVTLIGTGTVDVIYGDDDEILIDGMCWNDIIIYPTDINIHDIIAISDRDRFIVQKSLTNMILPKADLPSTPTRTIGTNDDPWGSRREDWIIPNEGIRTAVFCDEGGSITVKGCKEDISLTPGSYAEFIYGGTYGNPTLNTQSNKYQFSNQKWQLVNLNHINLKTGLNGNTATLSCLNGNILKDTINFIGGENILINADDAGNITINGTGGDVSEWSYVLLNIPTSATAINNTKYICLQVGDKIEFVNDSAPEIGNKYAVYTGPCSTNVQGIATPPSTYIQLVYKQLYSDTPPNWYVAQLVDLTNPTFSTNISGDNGINLHILNNGQLKDFVTLSGTGSTTISTSDTQTILIDSNGGWNYGVLKNDNLTAVNNTKYLLNYTDEIIFQSPQPGNRFGVYTGSNSGVFDNNELPPKTYTQFYYANFAGGSEDPVWNVMERVDYADIDLSTNLNSSTSSVELHILNHNELTDNYINLSGEGGTTVTVNDTGTVIISSELSDVGLWNNVWLTGTTAVDKKPVIKNGNRYICSRNDTTTISAGTVGDKIAVYTAGDTCSATINGVKGTLLPHQYKELEYVYDNNESDYIWRDAEYVNLVRGLSTSGINNGEVALQLIDDQLVLDSLPISGSGTNTVTVDQDGTIVIEGSSDWNYGILKTSPLEAANNTKYLLSIDQANITFSGTPVAGTSRFGVYTDSNSGVFDNKDLPPKTYTEFYYNDFNGGTSPVWNIMERVNLAQSHLYVGSGFTDSNNATSNGNVKLKLFNNTLSGEAPTISGDGTYVNVISDAEGNITISGSDNDWTISYVTSNTATSFEGVNHTRYIIQHDGHTITDTNLGSGDRVSIYTGDCSATIVGKAITSGTYAEFQCKVNGNSKTWDTILSADVTDYMSGVVSGSTNQAAFVLKDKNNNTHGSIQLSGAGGTTVSQNGNTVTISSDNSGSGSGGTQLMSSSIITTTGFVQLLPFSHNYVYVPQAVDSNDDDINHFGFPDSFSDLAAAIGKQPVKLTGGVNTGFEDDSGNVILILPDVDYATSVSIKIPKYSTKVVVVSVNGAKIFDSEWGAQGYDESGCFTDGMSAEQYFTYLYIPQLSESNWPPLYYHKSPPFYINEPNYRSGLQKVAQQINDRRYGAWIRIKMSGY